MKSRIIISDIHGCFNTLVALIAKLPKDVPITFAGDYIDRGPDSRKVIEFVRSGGYDCVIGNHEQMMIDDIGFRTKEDGTEQIYVDYYHSAWAGNGGVKCLNSYLVDAEEELATGEKINIRPYDIKALKEDVAWLKTLPYHIEYKDIRNDKGDYLLVTHTTAADVWDETDRVSARFKNGVTWDRKTFPKKIPGIYNVYGHTPQEHKATVKGHFACIDTGAYFKDSRYGKLTALSFPDMTVYEQENVE